MAPIVLCVGRVPKQSKMAIEAEIENNFVYYLNSKCCRVPLVKTPVAVYMYPPGQTVLFSQATEVNILNAQEYY